MKFFGPAQATLTLAAMLVAAGHPNMGAAAFVLALVVSHNTRW